MGYSIHRLEIIKARLIASNPKDLKFLFEFVEEQFTSNGDIDSKYSGLLENERIKRMQVDIRKLDLQDMEILFDFVAEKIQMSRVADKAEIILDNLNKVEFYTRELKYSKIEKFLFNLTSI